MSSVLEQVYTKDAEYINIEDRCAVRTFGDVQKEYIALRTGAMIYDCSNYGIFEVRG